MRKKAARRVRRDETQWAGIVQRFESSELSATEFCRREGLGLSSFHRWQGKLRSPSSGTFIELVPTAPPIASSPSWSLEVSLPNGVSLRFQG
jgi:hypothetical protein